MSDNDEKEQDLCDTADENRNLVELYDKYGQVELFLKRKEKVYARGLVLQETEFDVFIDCDFDIDGCVLELRDLGEVAMKVRHMSFFPRGKYDLRNIFPFLKKHLDLTKFSDNEIQNVRHSIGFQLFYEYGWECWVGLIPKHKRNSVLLNQKALRHVSLDTFEMLKTSVKQMLLGGRLSGMGIKSMAKNSMCDLGRLTILPDDSQYYLRTVQQALWTHENADFRLVCFCFRFGEKMSGELSLAEFGSDNIVRGTVHAAVNIGCDSDLGIDMLWSSDGVQQVCGRRGTLSTCLSFSDCANYQSNLDGRLIDISPEIREVCVYGNEVRFVQLYADIPHCLPNARYHPVSGSIAVGICAPVTTCQSLSKDAERYISTLEGNVIGIRNSKCSMEFVTELPTSSTAILAKDYFDVGKLRTLLESRAMLAPFSREAFVCVRNVGFWAVKELHTLHRQFQNTGNIDATWRAYQLELLLEKLIWGRPLCWRSTQYSTNLGPGALRPSRSSTDSFGFLALEQSTCCMSTDDDIPNVVIWTQSDVFGKLIKRSVGFHDHIDSTPMVLGRRLIYVLLQDLFENGNVLCRFNAFLAALKREDSTLPVVGMMTLSRLVEILSGRRELGNNMAYRHLRKMLTETGKTLQEYVEAGIKELDLKLFPAIETIDRSRNEVMKWSKTRKFWRIIRGGEATENSECETMLSDVVRSEVERRGLVYPSRMKSVPLLLPWIPICGRKLDILQLSEEERILVLTFVSCVAFLMEGWYVDYFPLAVLIQELPINQHKMKDLEILSKLTLSGCNKVKVFRLHHTIPHKIGTPWKKASVNVPLKLIDEKKEDQAKLDPVAISESVSNRISEEPETLNEYDVYPRENSCQSANQRVYQKWSGAELDLLEGLKTKFKDTPLKVVFSEYKIVCESKCIPFRTFNTFKSRYLRQ